MGELDPRFDVHIWFDGDDSPEIQTETFISVLDLSLRSLVRNGYCRAFEISKEQDA